MANGFTTLNDTGSVVPRHSTTVAIASEDLYLSLKEVRVAYVFFSSGRASERVPVAFPMPPVAFGAASAAGSEPSAATPGALGFSVTVEGRPAPVRARQIAVAMPSGAGGAGLQPADLTERLTAAGLDPDGRYADLLARIRALPEATAHGLQAAGLLTAGSLAEARPNWHTQTVFEWEQEFTPGETRVEVRYTPMIGGEAGDVDEWLSRQKRETFCADTSIVAGARRWEFVRNSAPSTLTYLLSAGRYWNGPIRNFRLVVDKGQPRAIVTFCPAEARKISPTQFEWRATNFMPTRDISVMFMPDGE